MDIKKFLQVFLLSAFIVSLVAGLLHQASFTPTPRNSDPALFHTLIEAQVNGFRSSSSSFLFCSANGRDGMADKNANDLAALITSSRSC